MPFQKETLDELKKAEEACLSHDKNMIRAFKLGWMTQAYDSLLWQYKRLKGDDHAT